MGCRHHKKTISTIFFVLPICTIVVVPNSLDSAENCPEGPVVIKNGKVVQSSEQQRLSWCEGINAGKNRDFKLAQKHLLPFAKTGDPTANYIVGSLLLRPLFNRSQDYNLNSNKNVEDLPTDIRRGLRMLRAAVADGHPGAKSFLASMHFVGAGVPKDEEKALSLAHEAARKGDHFAFYLLFGLYHERQDFARYYKWQYLFFNCHPNRKNAQEMWKLTKHFVFETEPDYRDSISDGEKLLEEWKRANRNRLCPQ